MEHQQNQPPQGGVPGPTGRRLHIAHRRSPSELTPLMSMFSSPGMEQLAIQQQIELLQQQQQQIQATHQQYVNMGMIPPAQHLAPGGYNPLQPQMQNLSPQPGFQFPNQMQQQQPQQQMNPPMGAPTQPLSHRRNQSALPNMGMGPPPAPSSGASGSAFGDFGGHPRENNNTRGGRGGGPPGGGHQRRHSLALPEAKKAAELAQQKRTTSGFQFPIPGAAGAAPAGAERTDSPSGEDKNAQGQAPGNLSSSAPSLRGRGGGHGRSQSMAVGANGRGGSSMRGGGSFQFPPMQATADAGASGQGNDFQKRGSVGHNRNSSRNFEGNWRNQPAQGQQDQQGPMGNFQGQQQQQGGFQPGHRNRGSVNQSINSLGSFQYGNQPQLVQLPQGQMALVQQPLFPGQQLNPLQMSQLQALQAAQMNGHVGLQGSQHAPQLSSQQQQQQRKTLFTPYLPQATLPALLGDGQLVSGILRVNKKNRSDAYVSTQDGLLDADIFICGSKDRNRALEGDLVAVELLDVDEVWGQKREKEEKKKRKDITDTRSSGSTNGTDRAHRDNSTTGDEQPSTNEGGIRRRGSLRQRPTQKKNDDVEVEGQSLLLVEEEEVNDEQKPLYAGHIVAVIERVAGQMFSGTLGLLRPSSQATKEKQEAERLARDGGSGRHQEQRQQDKPKIVWFKPTDKRVPLIAIPTEQAPRDFVEKHQDYADRIFVACIKRWPITSLHPFGTLVEQLGKMGELKVETDALLRDNNFASDDFSDAVTRSVGLDEWSLAKEDEAAIAARRDFRDEKTFTIDPNGANELDDAIHVKEVDGKIEIGIHIADVAHFIKANSLVDREAKKRGTAVYLMNRTCAMLPPKIASEICSLTPGQERLTVSVVFKVNPLTGAVSDDETWIGKSIIKSAGKLTYKDVDAVLSGHVETKLQGAEFKDIQILHAVAQKFREQRLGTDGETIAPLRLIYQLDDENVPVEQNIFDSTSSHELIEELMHKANAYVAQKIAKGLPEKALLRRQGPSNPRRLQTFADRMNRLGYEIDTTSSGTLQNSLFKVDDTNLRKGMETLLVKTMQRAKYFIAGKTPAHLHPHYALNLPLYTHFTNPSRRYADLVVHRQLEAVLSEGKIEYNEDIDMLVKTTESGNTKKDSAQNAQEQSVHIESCRIMDRKREEAGGELISEGIVICVYDSAFDVLIPEYGFEKRVHCDQLPLKKAEFRKNDRILELYWEKGVPSSAYVPEDERPRPGLSQRTTNAAAAAKQAAVAERAKKEHEEAQRKQMETGTISTDDVDALFDDEDDVSDIAEGLSGVSLAERPTQSVPPSPTRNSLTATGNLHRTRSDSKVPAGEPVEAKLSAKEKYLKLFTLREENGEYIQDVKEMTRVPVILKTDLTKSPPCLTIRSLNPYAL
ncbi:RNB-domain-containing protein [Venustampulla echinocandica]|uniref:RNB-domain-containing protein n=1 Tax=Venustampulla echinocandica TaxID=2656787 RepID=A0A370TCT5_9HELO|nr:RNB-domain-containing protein [Venustampulla echinocandica]RDL32045.1 RNB-domain-containing protein [Venustampulla echinocandica]